MVGNLKVAVPIRGNNESFFSSMIGLLELRASLFSKQGDALSSNDVRFSDRQIRLDVALAILVMFGAPVLSAADVSAHVVHLYKNLWGARA